MVGSFSGYLVRRLQEQEMIEESQCELYQYGLECLLGKFLNCFIVFMCAIVINEVVSSTVFLIFFLILRGRTGGYHASTEVGCTCGTLLIYLIAIKVVIPLLEKDRCIAFLCLCIVSVVVWMWAPVNHPNVNFSKVEMRQYRNRARTVLVLELLMIGILRVLEVCTEYYFSAISGMLLCAFLIIFAKVKGQEVKIQ